MKKFIVIAGVLLSTSAFAAKQTINNGETMGQARTKINSNFTEVYTQMLAGDCTVGPCLDGTSDGGTLIKLYGPGTYWTALQAGNAAANRSWRLPIDAPPSAGTTRLMNMDEYGQMGFVDPATFATPTGSAASMTVNASGFNGNLTTDDNTIQEIAQKLDDLVAGSGSVSDTAYGAGWNGDTTTAPSKNAVYDKIETLAGGHDAVTLGTDADAILGLSTQQITLDSQTANYVFAAPNGSAGDPTFRALVSADIPFASPGAIGGTTPAAGTFTTLGAGASGFSVDADGDVTAKSVTITRTTSPTAVRFYEGTGGGDNYIDLTLSGNLSGDSTVNLDALITTSAFDDTPDNGSTTTAPTSNWAYDHAALAMSDTVVGHVEAATTAETNTGTSTTLAVTPDGLSGSVYGQKEIGWVVKKSSEATAVADGTDAIVIPSSMNGMNLVDVTCAIHSTANATSGTTTVVLRRVRLGTAMGDGTSQYDLTFSTPTVTVTWDGAGTNPGISSSTLAAGDQIVIAGFATAANNGIFTVASVSSNAFTLSNASGVENLNDTGVTLTPIRHRDMTSTGVTIGYAEFFASDETVDTSNDDVLTGDKIYVDVNAITSPAQTGLSCTAVLQTP